MYTSSSIYHSSNKFGMLLHDVCGPVRSGPVGERFTTARKNRGEMEIVVPPEELKFELLLLGQMGWTTLQLVVTRSVSLKDKI